MAVMPAPCRHAGVVGRSALGVVGTGRLAATDQTLAGLAACVGTRVVAEGVEDPADLQRVRSAGIELAQGFLLGRPGPAASWPPPGRVCA